MDDVETIEKALYQLSEHFEKQGKVFICGFYLTDESKQGVANMIANRVSNYDAGDAMLYWGKLLTDLLNDDERQPWQQ